MQEERELLVSENATLTRLGGHINTYQDGYNRFIEEYGLEFEDAGYDLEGIVTLVITQKPLEERSAGVAARLEEVQILTDGSTVEVGTQHHGLTARETALRDEITTLQEQLNAPQKEYQEYIAQLAVWTAKRSALMGAADKVDTIEYLNARIKWATEDIPEELERQHEERRDLVRQIHAEVLEIRRVHERLYAPVQKIASEASANAETLQLEFEAHISTVRFTENFLDFIHKNRKGRFQGEDESRKAVYSLMDAHDMSLTEDVVKFTDAVFAALNGYERNGVHENVSIESQLRGSKKPLDLYDFLFGLGYLDIHYTLRLGGKNISQLSPGEKGALLLVFYLLLDTEEIPIIIDQPEHNLDNESVVRLLVDCIRKARSRRQVIIVTHNPNLAVYCDADQIIHCTLDKANRHTCSYSTGAIEDYDINQMTVNVLEGTYPAFDNRRRKYHRPIQG